MLNENNTKRARFKRLAVCRTNKILKRLKILGNCSNRSVYEFTDKEIQKIFTEIEKGVKETKEKFKKSKHKEFKL